MEANQYLLTLKLDLPTNENLTCHENLNISKY